MSATRGDDAVFVRRSSLGLTQRAGLCSALVLWGALLSWGSHPVAAQTTVFVGFGDSITAGTGDDPEREETGYPPRLEVLLVSAGVDAQVINEGVGAERTPEGLARLPDVLAGPGNVLLLMEGTNDISRSISPETTLFNLNEMARQASSAGWQTIHATLIPRLLNARFDPSNTENQRLCQRIRNLAGNNGRQLVDPFEIYSNLPDLYGTYYWDDPIDPVGHPNPAGYDVLARAFFNVITGVDAVAPVAGLVIPADGDSGVAPDVEIEVDVWDFGDGIDLAGTSVLVDGVPVSVQATSSAGLAQLRYRPPQTLSGAVTLVLQSRDVAGNTTQREISRFTITGSVSLNGDLDSDGRVDGQDLIAFARRFGAVQGQARYAAAADFNRDGTINGTDLAVLADNFGRSL